MKDTYFDNTRIQEYRSCPRKFYFRHTLDLVQSGPISPPLIFGSSWHDAMDVVWHMASGSYQGKERAPKLGKEEVIAAAYEAFVACWVKGGMTDPMQMDSDQIDDLGARTPFTAHEMLHEYVLQRWDFLSEIELLAFEQPFAVPLDPNEPGLLYVGRMDKEFRYRKRIICGEHKTTSLYAKAGGFRTTFLDMFSPNSQVDGYLHALHMKYGDEALSVWVDGALVHKTVHDAFVFIPVERQHSQLDAWLWETRYWISIIQGNIAGWEESAPDSPYMAAFPKNTSACQDFARNCPYIDICKSLPNPMIDRTNIPPGYVEEIWSPFDRLSLEKLGLEKQDA